MLGMLLQRFDFVDHLHYQLKTKTTLTVKPDDFHIQVRPRPGVRLERTGARADAPTARATPAAPRPRPAPLVARHGTPLSVLFGSNLGTAESIADPARPGGHRARLRRAPSAALDDHVDDLPDRRRGARRLLVLQRHPAGQRRRVLPVDQRRRRRTRRRVSPTPCSAAATPSGPRPTRRCPTLLDDAARGARRAAGSTRAARATPQATSTPRTAAWHADLWSDLAAALDLPAEVAAAGPDRPAAVDHADQPAADQPGDRVLPRPGRRTVRANRELIHGANGQARASGRPATSRSRCPPASSYRAGDHLGVLPRNSVDLIRRVMRPVRPRRRAVRHDHPEQRHPHPPADRRARPAARGARQLRRAAGRRDPRRHRGPRPLHRRPRAATARGPDGDDDESQARYREQVARRQPLAARPARGLPGLRAAVRGVTSTCCRRCARATTRSPRRRW